MGQRGGGGENSDVKSTSRAHRSDLRLCFYQLYASFSLLLPPLPSLPREMRINRRVPPASESRSYRMPLARGGGGGRRTPNGAVDQFFTRVFATYYLRSRIGFRSIDFNRTRPPPTESRISVSFSARGFPSVRRTRAMYARAGRARVCVRACECRASVHVSRASRYAANTFSGGTRRFPRSRPAPSRVFRRDGVLKSVRTVAGSGTGRKKCSLIEYPSEINPRPNFQCCLSR